MTRRVFPAVFVSLLLFCASAMPITLIESVPPGGPTGGTAPGTNNYFTQPFTLKQDVANFQLDLYAGAFDTVATTYILSNQVGPGTNGDLVANGGDVIAVHSQPTAPFPEGFVANGTLTTIFDAADIPAIAAGDYYLTLAVESPISGTGWSFQYANPNENEFAAINQFIRQARNSVPQFQIGFANRNQAEASTFEPFGTNQVMRMRLSGDVGPITPPGIPGGNETFFDFDPPAINGVGVTVADLGAEHGNDSQSIGGSEDTTTSTLFRTFSFDSADTDADSVDVYIHAILEGRLIVDNFSFASAEATIEITNDNGDRLDFDRVFVPAEALGGKLVEANVLEVLTLSASLTPGEEYNIFSTLTLHTRAGLMGAARAFFADTFAYEISADAVNPFGDVGSQTTSQTSDQPPSDLEAMPEPATAGLALIGLGAMMTRRRRTA